MTKKEELQREILQTVKPGTKPSDIKKLKRSKSADDIANPPTPLLADQLKEKQQQIESLTKESETKSTTIRLLREKLDRDTKEQELIELKKQLKETKQQLDDSLTARIAGVKVFGQEHSKRNQAEQELNETIDQASNELEKGDNQVSQLRTKLFTARQQITNLERDLKLERIRKGTQPLNNLPNSNNSSAKLDYLPYTLYALATILFTLWLTNLKNKQS